MCIRDSLEAYHCCYITRDYFTYVFSLVSLHSDYAPDALFFAV